MNKSEEYINQFEKFLKHNLELEYIQNNTTVEELLNFLIDVKANYLSMMKKIGSRYMQSFTVNHSYGYQLCKDEIENLLPYKNFIMKMISHAHVADCIKGGAEKFLQEFIMEYENIK